MIPFCILLSVLWLRGCFPTLFVVFQISWSIYSWCARAVCLFAVQNVSSKLTRCSFSMDGYIFISLCAVYTTRVSLFFGSLLPFAKQYSMWHYFCFCLDWHLYTFWKQWWPEFSAALFHTTIHSCRLPYTRSASNIVVFSIITSTLYSGRLIVFATAFIHVHFRSIAYFAIAIYCPYAARQAWPTCLEVVLDVFIIAALRDRITQWIILWVFNIVIIS